MVESGVKRHLPSPLPSMAGACLHVHACLRLRDSQPSISDSGNRRRPPRRPTAEPIFTEAMSPLRARVVNQSVDTRIRAAASFVVNRVPTGLVFMAVSPFKFSQADRFKQSATRTTPGALPSPSTPFKIGPFISVGKSLTICFYYRNKCGIFAGVMSVARLSGPGRATSVRLRKGICQEAPASTAMSIPGSSALARPGIGPSVRNRGQRPSLLCSLQTAAR